MRIPALIAVLALVAAGLAGCAAEPQARPGTDVFVDAAFKPPSVPIDPASALAMTPAMK